MNNAPINHLHAYTKDKTAFNIEALGFESPYNTDLLHRHDFYQIIILEEGSGSHTIDFEKKELTAPCISVVFPQQIHNLKLSDDAKGFVVMFDETIFCSEVLSNELREYNVDLYRKINYVNFTNKKQERIDILSILAHIQSLIVAMNAPKKMQIKFLIKIILIKIVDSAEHASISGAKDRYLQTYIHFRELVDREFYTNRTVEYYCDKLNISPKKLNSLCKQYSGATALSLIHDRLSMEIKKIFTFEDISLKEIAFTLGFNSQSALNKYIFTKFECTPSELKGKILSKL
jgi:AraC family transcriptional activator of pobA